MLKHEFTSQDRDVSRRDRLRSLIGINGGAAEYVPYGYTRA